MLVQTLVFVSCSLALVVSTPSPCESQSNGVIQDAIDACAVNQGYSAEKYRRFVPDYMSVRLDDCVAACAMKKLGTMSEGGVYTGEGAKHLMAQSDDDDDGRMDKVIERCAKFYGRGGRNACRTVKNLYKCYKFGFRRLMIDDWFINGLINQALLFTFENYEDAYPVQDVVVWTLPDFRPF